MIYQWLLESSQIEQMCGDAVRPDYVLNATVFARDGWIELIHPKDCEDNEGWARVALRRITDGGDRQW